MQNCSKKRSLLWEIERFGSSIISAIKSSTTSVGICLDVFKIIDSSDLLYSSMIFGVAFCWTTFEKWGRILKHSDGMLFLDPIKKDCNGWMYGWKSKGYTFLAS